MLNYLITSLIICIWGIISWKLNLAEKTRKKEHDSDNSSLSNQLVYYLTDEECIRHCYFLSDDIDYAGHQCLINLDAATYETYKKILKEGGRQALWDYGVKEGFFRVD